MKKASLSLLAVLACMSPASGVTTQIADFTGAEPPAGWTVANGEYRSPEYAGAVEYVNSDLMAQVMSPLDIRLSAIKAGILTPDVWKRLAADRCQALEDDLSWMHP